MPVVSGLGVLSSLESPALCTDSRQNNVSGAQVKVHFSLLHIKSNVSGCKIERREETHLVRERRTVGRSEFRISSHIPITVCLMYV
jgi:hypothetical protein